MKKSPKQTKADTLTARELKLVKMVCREKINREMAEALGLGLRTLEKLRRKVYEKTGAGSSVGLLKWAVKYGVYRIAMPK